MKGVLRYLSGFFKKDFELTIFVTNKCNASCGHCFYSSQMNAAVPQMQIPAFKKISLSIPPDCKKIIFTGGEPFLREDLPEILTIFQNAGVREFTVVTNGILTQRIGEFVDFITKIDSVKVMIALSLDGPEEIHDRIRRHPGAFKKAIQTLQILKEKKADFAVQTVVSNLNCNAISAFDEYLLENFGVKVHYQFIRGAKLSGLPERLKRPFNPDQGELLPSFTEMRRFLDILGSVFRQRISKGGNFLESVFSFTVLECKQMILKKQTPIFSCLAGRKRAVIYPSGALAICEYMDPISKNLEEADFDFSKLWYSCEISAQREITRSCYCTHGCFVNIVNSPRFLYYLAKNIFRFLSPVKHQQS